MSYIFNTIIKINSLKKEKDKFFFFLEILNIHSIMHENQEIFTFPLKLTKYVF